jgi:hypothetical protein
MRCEGTNKRGPCVNLAIPGKHWCRNCDPDGRFQQQQRYINSLKEAGKGRSICPRCNATAEIGEPKCFGGIVVRHGRCSDCGAAWSVRYVMKEISVENSRGLKLHKFKAAS